MTEVIAECGVNFSSISEAKLMIKKAKEAGADYAKFQLFNEQQRSDPREVVLTKEEAKELFEYGKEIGQKVFFTPMFLEAVYWLGEIGATELIKIRYFDRYEYSIIEKALKTAKRVIMSIDKSYRISPDLIKQNILKIDFLWCIPKYPAMDNDYSFKCIDFDFFSGISDHTKGLNVAKRMLNCHGRLLEKHIMLEGTHPIEEEWSCTFRN